MTTDIDLALDRRQLRRRVWRWRIVAGVLALVALGALGSFARHDETSGWFGSKAHIARVSVVGLITENRDQIALLKKLSEDDSVKAVILAVDSPGGTTTGGEVLYGAIENLAHKKPVVAVAGTIATSAAYMISLAAERFYVHGNTITGSVGVIFQYPEVHDALDKLGIKMNEIKSGNLKAVPSMFAPLEEPGKQVIDGMIKDGQTWFLGLVAKRRGIATASVPGLEQGSIFSGRQALQHKLVDAIGTEDDAIAWLESEKHVAAKLPVIDRRARVRGAWAWIGDDSGSGAGPLGSAAEAIFARIIGAADLDRLRLDGLMSIWHGETN
jgi:protease-4